MTSSVVASFKRYHDADRAIERLNQYGFDEEQISAITQVRVMEAYLNRYNRLGWRTVSGAISGATLGGLTGLLVGLGAVSAPGLGSILVAGMVASALGTGGVGAAAGGLVGALVALGLPRQDAEKYKADIKEGAVVVAVHEEQRVVEASQVLRQSGGESVNIYQSELFLS
jgi:uncharacterized membrane protein